MARIRWSPAAIADLDDIWFLIALDNPSAADRMVDRLRAADRRLADFPEIAVARNDLAPGLRAWPVLDYLILYRADPDEVRVVRVLHGARDLGEILSEDP